MACQSEKIELLITVVDALKIAAIRRSRFERAMLYGLIKVRAKKNPLDNERCPPYPYPNEQRALDTSCLLTNAFQSYQRFQKHPSHDR